MKTQTKFKDSKPAVRIAPSHADISERAYTLWIDSGRPEGKEDELWLQAERELSGLNEMVTDRDETLAQKLRDAEPNFPPRGDRSATSL